MFDIYLKFADHTEAVAALTAAGFPLCDGALASGGQIEEADFALDIVFGNGTIWHASTPAQSLEGQATALLEASPGFHINLRLGGPCPACLLPYLSHPVTPRCQFVP